MKQPLHLNSRSTHAKNTMRLLEWPDTAALVRSGGFKLTTQHWINMLTGASLGGYLPIPDDEAWSIVE